MTPLGRTGVGAMVEAARAIDFSVGDLVVPSPSMVVDIGVGAMAMRPVSRSDGPAISRSGESESDGTEGGSSAGVPGAVASPAGAACGVSPAFCCAQTVPVSKTANPSPAPHRAPKIIATTSPPTLMPNLYTSGYAARAVPPQRHES